MGHCPLLGKDCVGNLCQLWLKTKQREGCSLELIPHYLAVIAEDLTKKPTA
jgi:hypothetical protein